MDYADLDSFLHQDERGRRKTKKVEEGEERADLRLIYLLAHIGWHHQENVT